MQAAFCLLFPSIISVWLYGYLGKEKRKRKQLFLQYFLSVIVVNALSFFVKCIIMKAGSGYVVFMLTDMPFLSAMKFLVMASAISVICAVGLFLLHKVILPLIIKSRFWDFVKCQFRVMTVRKALGYFFAVFSFVVYSFVYEKYFFGIIHFVAFFVLGMLTCKPRRAIWKLTILILLTCVTVAVLMFFPFYELFNETVLDFIRTYTPYTVIIYNSLLILSVITFLNAAVNDWKTSVSMTAGICAVLTVINGYVYRFRGKEFIFPDIFSVVTAGNVAQNYDLSLQYHTFTMLTLIALLIFSMFSVEQGRQKGKFRGRLLSGVASGILFAGFLFSTGNVPLHTWKWDGTLMSGYYVNFYISARDYFIEEPECYSDEYIDDLEESYKAEETDMAHKKPNILVIMSESYADFNVFGSEVRTSKPVTPFWDSLKENTVKGYALTSVFGGTTANAEFEFLTGFTMNFLPAGSTPYQQYIHRDTFSIAWLLNSYGYQCISTHPYVANGWNRPAVYPHLGFQESTFQEDYPDAERIRSYVSDQAMFMYILDVLKKEADLPVFLFGITMQNHGGYSAGDGNFTQTISLEGYSQEYSSAETYLSLVNQSDKAMEYLFTELDKFEEDTIVLVFGDHFPQVEQEFYTELHGGEFESLDCQMKQYTVPFLIWANFDIEEKNVECTSLNYLGRYLLENAGLDLPPFYNFLKEMEQHVPAINAMGYYSYEDDRFLPYAETNTKTAEWIEKYKILQYNGLIDSKNASPVFFENYIHTIS